MDPRFELLMALASEVERDPSLEVLLEVLVDTASRLVDAPRASVRLLDAERDRLLAYCRAGEPLHTNPQTPFRVGEGLIGWVVAERKPLLLGHAMDDPRFVARPGMKEDLQSFLGVPILDRDACIGVVAATSPDRDHFTPEQLQLLQLAAQICQGQLRALRMQRLTEVDPLTGVLNRRGLEVAFRPAVWSERTGDEVVAPLSVLVADVDDFKGVNDRYGHPMGDQVLHLVARALAGAVRASDVVVRWGGDEFLVVLPGVGAEEAGRIAERVRTSVAQVALSQADALRVSLSIGLAERNAGEGRDQLVARADRALLRAKAAGRDRIEVGGAEGDAPAD